MTQLQSTPDIADQRRGACPTLREPMQTGDGLLARLRPLGGLISPGQLRSLAALAEQFGNGQVEITARGNLQVRGLRAQTVPNFAQAVEAIIPIETGLAIETSPLAGLDPAEIADPRPLEQAVRNAVAVGDFQAKLGPKVTVVIDGGGRIGGDGLSADIGLRAQSFGNAPMWALAVGGHALGLLQTQDAAGAAWAVLSLLAARGPHARGRDLDAAALRHALAPIVTAPPMQPPPARLALDRIELTDGRIGATIGLAFGSASAAALDQLTNAAQAAGIAQFHLAPDHRLIAICPSDAAALQFRQAASASGFITAATDPRRAISACIGSDGCASGMIAARRSASELARLAPEFFDGSFRLHVSGCAKGCAHPRPALLTLVGSGTGIDLVIDGSAKGTPALHLSSDAVPHATQQLAALWRDERALGESVASCFKRLGAARIAAAVRQG